MALERPQQLAHPGLREPYHAGIASLPVEYRPEQSGSFSRLRFLYKVLRFKPHGWLFSIALIVRKLFVSVGRPMPAVLPFCSDGIEDCAAHTSV